MSNIKWIWLYYHFKYMCTETMQTTIIYYYYYEKSKPNQRKETKQKTIALYNRRTFKLFRKQLPNTRRMPDTKWIWLHYHFKYLCTETMQTTIIDYYYYYEKSKLIKRKKT
jgi:hypothetical protein